MRKAVLVAVAAIVCGLAMGQTAPREPVIRPARGGGSPSPTPTPLPDPSGVYQGNAQFTLSGVSETFNETWRVDLQSRSCPECVPGQYFVYGTNFNATAFSNGAVERGGVHGSVSPNGQAFDLNLFGINCSFVNPSGQIGGAPYSGKMWGGSFGESVGVPLLIQNGSMSGRISGRDCLGQIVTANVSLSRQSTSVPASCNSIAGDYGFSSATTCGGGGSATVTIEQAGCYFSFLIPSVPIGIEGTITGPSSATIRINHAPCGAAIYTGTATISGNTITGTYSGVSNGAAGCCLAGPYSGSFSLTKN